MTKNFLVDNLKVYESDSAEEMGEKAASFIADEMKKVYQQKGAIRMMFAAAPSQNTTLQHLLEMSDLPWESVEAFHMDEYIGIQESAPQSFRNYLKTAIFSKVPIGKVNYIPAERDDSQTVAKEYGEMLDREPMDIIILGVGENGHIAFNDPPFSSFSEPETVKIIQLAETSRIQQVHDGCFENLDLVPKGALTVTIPTFCKASSLFCVVPNNRKAEAIRKTLKDPVSENCPASILRTHKNSYLFIDKESASLL